MRPLARGVFGGSRSRRGEHEGQRGHGRVAVAWPWSATTHALLFVVQTRAVDRNGSTISFDYGADGNLVALQPPGRVAHRFEYTSTGRENRYDLPDIGLSDDTTEWAYNDAQQLKRIVRPDGQGITFDYDGGGRLSATRIPRERIERSYDPDTGNLTRIDTADESLTFGYNKDLLTTRRRSGSATGEVTERFDSERRVVERTVNDGAGIGFSYDADGLVIQAGALTIDRSSDTGLVTGTELNGVTGAREHNGFAELTARTVKQGGATVYAVEHERDDVGRIVQETETVVGEMHTFSYAYDADGRLTEVRRDGEVRHSYSYDQNGNRLEHVGPTGTENGAFDARDRLTKYDGASYSYTANGELKTKTTDGGTTAYDYDVLGNLCEVQLPDGRTIDYVVDGRNRPVAKRVDSTLARAFVYKDELNPVAELDGSANVAARFVYGDEANVPAYMIKNGTRYRIVADHLGSVRVVIDTETGAVAQRLDYSPFGKAITDTNPGFQPFGFAGGTYDPATALVRFGARDYDPDVGRWTSKDVIGSCGGDPNLYGYVLNDPVNQSDVSGFESGNSCGGDSEFDDMLPDHDDFETVDVRKKAVDKGCNEFNKRCRISNCMRNLTTMCVYSCDKLAQECKRQGNRLCEAAFE